MALGIGSRGYKDFGLSKSMTLPINSSAIEPDPKVMAQNAYMPGEGKPAKKKHATFALDVPPESDKETVKRKKPSLFRRLFRRRKKTDRTEPYLVQPDDHDDEALVQVVRSQSDPDLSASKVSGEEGEGKSRRRKGESTKTSRAKSTALEDITPVPVTAEQGTTGAKARGNGQHASRTTEKVETAQLTESKQHTPKKAEQDVHEDESEADHSTVKITSIDSESAQEDAATPRVVETEVKKRNGKKKKHISSTRASGGDFGPPLVTSTPIKEEGPENGDKPRQRKKRLSTNAEESSATEDGSKLSKGSPRKATGPGGKTGKEGKKIKKKTSTSAEESLTGNSIAKSPSKKSLEVSKSSISSGVASPEVKTVQVETNNVSSAENPFPASISVDEVDGSYEMERNARSRRSGSPKSRYSMGVQEGEDAVTTEKEKVKRKKSSKKAKGAEGEAENAAVGATKEKVKKKKSKHKESEKQKDAEKITVGVIAKEKADKKKPKSEDTDKKKKRKKSKEESSSRKTSRDQSQSPSRKASTTAKEDASMVKEEMPMTKELPEEPLSLSVDVPPAQSAAISGSIESNTLTFVSTKKGSRSSLNQPGDDGEEEEEMERQTTNTLPRRKSADHSRRSSSSRDVSEFRNELREASRSQHDMPEAVNSSVTIDIDPNIKVKKSGLIKGKNLSRPSIFDQSSSPEPEEVAPISSGPVEDNLLDSEFKVKKSGVVQGRKTYASTRPSILDEKEKEPTPVDIQRGEMKYNKKVIEDVDMDFSAIPETEPTLGVVAGRDRLDTANRSLIKRRPVSQKESLLLDSKEGKMMGTERVDLSQVKGGQNPRGSVGAAKQMFESSTKQDAASKYSARFSKLEKKPTNAASSTQQASVPAAEKKAPWARPAKGGETDTGKPSWVAMAQHKRSSYVETKETTTTTTTATPSKAPAPSRTPISSSSATKESSRPQLGTVAQRLAMFQKS